MNTALLKHAKNLTKFILVNGFFRPFYALRTFHPFWFYLLNREGRRLYLNNQPRLSALEERISNDLKQDGIAVTDIDELFPGRDFLPELQRYAMALRPHAKIAPKAFLLALWSYNNATLDFLNPYVRLALEPSVLNIFSKYMGMCIRFFDFTLNITMPVGKEQLATHSQRWHRDPEDIKVCKMFIYLNDVGEEAGPFTYVLQSHYGGRFHATFKQKMPQRIRPADEEVRRSIPAEFIRSYTGKAGTIIFADPTAIHMGGRAISKERIMFTAEFASRAALVPILYRYAENFSSDLSKLSPQARFAVSREENFLLKTVNFISGIQKKYCRY